MRLPDLPTLDIPGGLQPDWKLTFDIEGGEMIKVTVQAENRQFPIEIATQNVKPQLFTLKAAIELRTKLDRAIEEYVGAKINPKVDRKDTTEEDCTRFLTGLYGKKGTESLMFAIDQIERD